MFGRLRLHGVFPSLYGLLYRIGSLQVIIWRVEGWILLTGVSCVIVMGRRWIICYYIVVRLIGCGVWCLDLLSFLRSCQDRLWILYLVGGIGLESICLAFGILLLFAWCGVFGRSEIEGLLRTWKVRMISSWLLSVALYFTGLGLRDSPLGILSLCSLALSQYTLQTFSI